jgi:hypothetical protein
MGPFCAGAFSRPSGRTCNARSGFAISVAASNATAERGQALGGAGSGSDVGESMRGALAGHALSVVAEGRGQNVGVALVNDGADAPRRGAPPTNCSGPQRRSGRNTRGTCTRTSGGGERAALPGSRVAALRHGQCLLL